jgi:hypothetical protein
MDRPRIVDEDGTPGFGAIGPEPARATPRLAGNASRTGS